MPAAAVRAQPNIDGASKSAPALVPADLSRRSAAFLLDSILFLLAVYPVEMVVLLLGPNLLPKAEVGSYRFQSLSAEFYNLVLFCAVAFVFRFVYSGLFLSLKGATPGKLLVGIRVRRSDGSPVGFMRAALRETLGQGLGWVLFPLGHIPAFTRKDRRAMHDLLSGTCVVLQPPRGESSEASR